MGFVGPTVGLSALKKKKKEIEEGLGWALLGSSMPRKEKEKER